MNEEKSGCDELIIWLCVVLLFVTVSLFLGESAWSGFITDALTAADRPVTYPGPIVIFIIGFDIVLVFGVLLYLLFLVGFVVGRIYWFIEDRGFLTIKNLFIAGALLLVAIHIAVIITSP